MARWNTEEINALPKNGLALIVTVAFAIVAGLTTIVVLISVFTSVTMLGAKPLPTATATLTPTPTFDPALNAALPNNRIVAFYGIPGASDISVGYAPTAEVLNQLKQTASPYATADPSHPVKMGFDVVVDVADGFAGPKGLWSHRVDDGTIQSFVDFCQQNDLLLFLDLQFGRSPVKDEVTAMLPYLQKYSFVHLALDTEFHFPPTYGIPDVDVGSVDASDINWTIQQLHQLVNTYHVPRKILMIHQFRPEVLTNKSQIHTDPLVDIVVHTDGFGAVSDKLAGYDIFVRQQLIQYGGFKLFFKLDSPMMSAQDVLKINPAPLMITYQ
jgi:hypothetical protein